MKKKYNLIGAGFNHYERGNKGSSIYKYESQYIEWVSSGAEDTFYIDDHIVLSFEDKTSRKKYGWLLESKEIKPAIISHIKSNCEQYGKTMEAIFTHNEELLNLHEVFKFAPLFGSWIPNPKLYEKSKLVSMICSNKVMCDGHKNRIVWAKKLSGSVDFYGRGFNDIENKEEGLIDYMFSVAIENAQYNSYFTEKIQDCFATGTIPIYLGSPDIGKYFNPDGIINLDDNFDISQLTPDLYYDKLDAVKENLEIIKNRPINEDYIYQTYLKG